MNLLIPLLSERPDVVSNLMDHRQGEAGERLSLADVVASDVIPIPVRVALVSSSPQLQEAMSSAYVPIVEKSSWDSAVSETRTHAPVDANTWVMFIPVSPDRGVTVPDDDSPREQLTAFVDREGGTTTMSIALTGPLATKVVEGEHCALPSRGRCARGCGSCAIREVLGPRNGLVCMCRHGLQGG